MAMLLSAPGIKKAKPTDKPVSQGHELIAAHLKAGLRQIEVAERMGTKQSVIARMESGRALPSLRTLSRYAQAIGFTATVKLTRYRPDRKAAA